MNSQTAKALQELLERSGLRDPSLVDEDREELFFLAMRRLPDVDLEWLVARLADECMRRS